MYSVVIHQYGGPEVLKFEESPDPVAGAGEVLVRVAATSINPIDNMRRSGRAKDFFPIQFPGVIGMDLAGAVLQIGCGGGGVSVCGRGFAGADPADSEDCGVTS